MENIEGEYCEVCSRGGVETHHIIKRSQAAFLINCELNKVRLCSECHRGKNGIHSKNGHILDLKLKWKLQNNFEILLDKQSFTKEELKSILKVNENSVNSLCKLVKQDKGVFYRDNILIALMGGKKVTEEEVKELNESNGYFQQLG